MTSVLIVDDQALRRLGLTRLMEAQPDMTVVGEAVDGAEAVRKTAELNPDVILMDIRMPGVGGIDATRRIVGFNGGSGSRVLLMADFDHAAYAYEALHAGAHGFLLKYCLPEQLVAGIRAVAAGHTVLCPGLTHELVDAAIDGPARETLQTRRLAALTRREREILTAVATGCTNVEIADLLQLAESTVKSHVSRMFHRIGARDRVQAVIFADDTGLVRPA